MASECLSLGKLAERGALKFGDGYRTKSTELGETGFPILRVGSVGDGRVEASESHDLIRTEYRRAIGQKFSELGDIVLTTKGTVGRTARIDRDTAGWVYSPQVCYFRVIDETVVHPGYLYAYMRSASFKRQAAVFASQTDMAPYLSLKDLANIEIELPPLPEQRRIAKILGDLDDKIEANRKLNETLEAMARALFKSWFVDFDPVRAKMEGRQPEWMDAETAALFPGKLVDSELGMIPEGWEVKALDQDADFLNGLALQKYPAGDGPTLPVIKIAQLRRGDAIGADRCSADIPMEYVVKDGDILFSWSGSLEVELWCGGVGALNQHLFKVTSSAYPRWFLYHWTLHHLADFRTIAADKATTMGHITRGHLSEAKSAVPNIKLVQIGSKCFDPILDQIIQNRLNSGFLMRLRDLLLPKILSG